MGRSGQAETAAAALPSQVRGYRMRKLFRTLVLLVILVAAVADRITAVASSNSGGIDGAIGTTLAMEA